jgi:hypothetical protein
VPAREKRFQADGPFGMPSDAQERWQQVTASIVRTVKGLAEYYRRFPEAVPEMKRLCLHLYDLVEITCTREFPAGHEAPAKKQRAK